MAPKEYCTGCTACEHSCPAHCIEMKEDTEGFLYPYLAQPERCTHCGICNAVCPVVNKREKTLVSTLKGYGCYLKQEEEIWNSASGGVFYAAAKRIIENHGVAYGAAQNGVERVAHRKAVTLTEVQMLRKSKYTQSDLGDIFLSVKEDLKQQKQVLFSGTPCQVAGLKSFLGEKFNNLITIQVFCMGVLSPKIWQYYIRELEYTYQGKIVYFTTKDKLKPQPGSGKPCEPWRNPCFRIRMDNGRNIILDRDRDPIINAWTNNLFLRPACANCRFRLDDHSKCWADIAVGDFWGCENVAPECYQPLGTSAVLVNTEKGRQFLDSLSDCLEIKPVSVEKIFVGNPGVFQNYKHHPMRATFFEEVEKHQRSMGAIVRDLLGYSDQLEKLHLNIGVWGSFNTRRATTDITSNSGCAIAFHYCNSSLLSINTSETPLPEGISLPKNSFRAEMLQADFDKRFIKVLNPAENQAYDCLIFDFLEERFDLCRIQDSFVTFSDAAKDTGYPFESVNITEEERTLLWEKACLQIASCIHSKKHRKPVILVKAYLNDMYGDEKHRTQFSNLSWIRRINKRLSRYYQIFEQAFPEAYLIEVNDLQLLYCDKNHKHGCYPWHANEEYYTELHRRISNILVQLDKN